MQRPGQCFVVLLGLTLAFRCWLSASLPVTGDEAYFIAWGWHPAWGYYDHPPMVGWWLAALTSVSDDAFWLRLPSTLQPALLSLAIWWSLPRLWPQLNAMSQSPTPVACSRRDEIALMVLLAPANIWNVAITTDTPLVYFCVLSALAWLRAGQHHEHDGWRWYLLAGLFLAAAVLSKYFAALLGLAYLVDAWRRGTRRAIAGLALAFACCLPALALMAWWNSTHCWPNFMFNFVNRHDDLAVSPATPLLYVASLLYLLTPPVAWRALMHGRTGQAGAHTHAVINPGISLPVLIAIPLATFTLLSLAKTVGLHWMLSFIPLILVWVGLQVTDVQLRTLVRFAAGFALLHVVTIAILLRLPIETWKGIDHYDSLVMTTHHQALATLINAERAASDKPWVLATDSYSSAAVLGYNLREHVPVFGIGSSHARQDDIRTDFREYEGRNFLILRKSRPVLKIYEAYFDTVSITPIELNDARLWQVRGEGFRYEAYRARALQTIRDTYYRLPGRLPQCGCYFCDRYFAGEGCNS